MFPPRQKSAKVKKNMQFFHQIVGFDEDIEENIGDAVYDLIDNSHSFLRDSDKIEQMCDEFAIEALMPPEIMKQFEEKQYGNIDNESIADYFGLEAALVEAAKKFRNKKR